ncbi:ribonucleoside-diphosphate reductase large subunit-like [Silene latifolia]|uniref:ribonucleoside-diphosphate reductase large subunit-like n=1 Tax=Silene latifolia TaxID=37657 RepID=UPI003D77C6D7
MNMNYLDNCVVSDDSVSTNSIELDHPDRANLAVKAAIANLHNSTLSSISETIQFLSQLNPPLIPHDVCDIIIKNGDRLDNEIMHERDFDYWDYFGFQILRESCLLRAGDKLVERPQHMLMRKAVGIHKHDIDSAIQTYHLMSQGYFTHASVFQINAATQFNSCLIVCAKDYDGEANLDTIKPTRGIGLSFHDRCYGNSSTGTSVVTSSGILPPVLKLFNSNEHFEGVPAVYLEPWHADIYNLIDLVDNGTHSAGDRFYALWVPDMFMERVKSHSQWSLFGPDDAPGLVDCWGEEFERLYNQYEREGRQTKVVSAVDLWYKILIYLVPNEAFCMLFKDNFYRKNKNHIKFKAPYTDIVACTGPTEIITGNLASISLPKFVREKGVPSELQPCKLIGSCGSKNRYFDFVELAEVISVVTNNLDKIIDGNNYPDEAVSSNSKHRPIGIGVHGLADTFILLGIPFDSPEAHQLNKDIFETIYYHSLKTSCELAERDGQCQIYQGILEPDMWGVIPSDRWDWDSLRRMIAQNGVRNTVVLSVVLTTLTSQILGCNVSTEPYFSFLNVQSQKFIANHHLLHDLTEMGLWSSTLKNNIIDHGGSVEKIPEIPSELKAIYRTADEVKPKTLVDMALDRGCFLGETQIINIFPNYVNLERLQKLHFYIWENQYVNHHIKSR